MVSRSELAVILLCTGMVLVIATVQMQVVLGVELSPLMYVVPGLLGLAVGRTFVWLWRMRRHEAVLRTQVEQQAAEVQRLNAELQERVEVRTLELRAREAELLQSQKMEALGRLAGGVAHDFNNLLTAILQGAELLDEQAGQPDEVRELATEIQESAHRAAKLTGKLLSLGRRRRVVVPPRPIDLADVVRGLQPIVQRLLGSRSVVAIQVAPEVPAILGDRVHLEQVFVNLAVNARDAMPDGGRFSIELEGVSLAEAGVSLAEAAPHGVVRATIRDSGHGIPAHIREQVFEPLFTTKAPELGTGLGLSIVHSLVVGAGGAIRLESTEGVGTTFQLFWPALGADATVAEDDAESVASVSEPDPVGHRTILLIDDDSGVRRMLARGLRARGHTVTEAETGDEAEQLVRAGHTEFEVVLSDVQMPGRTGVELVPVWKTLLPEARVLLMTGLTEHVLDAEAQEALGIGAVLRKPFDMEEVLLRLSA